MKPLSITWYDGREFKLYPITDVCRSHRKKDILQRKRELAKETEQPTE